MKEITSNQFEDMGDNYIPGYIADKSKATEINIPLVRFLRISKWILTVEGILIIVGILVTAFGG